MPDTQPPTTKNNGSPFNTNDKNKLYLFIPQILKYGAQRFDTPSILIGCILVTNSNVVESDKFAPLVID